MRHPSRRSILVALATLAPSVGCYGSFNLTKKVYGWNGSLSNVVVRELVFLGMLIIPVYEVSLFIDAVILNLIEFITGSPPVSARGLGEGHQVTFERLPDQRTFRVVQTAHGEVVRRFRVRRTGPGGFELLDDEGRPVAAAEPTEAGSLRLLDGAGAPACEIDEGDLEQVARSLAHRPLSQAVAEALRGPLSERRLALRRAPTLFLPGAAGSLAAGALS